MFSGKLLVAMMLLASVAGCGPGADGVRHSARIPTHGSDDLETLARRFAPVLRMHAQEPFAVAHAAAVFHPTRPLVGYHVFFTDDVVRPHGGERLDHEVIWVEYDPVTLKVTDVATYWHRTVLRTAECIADAQSRSQRPIVDVQWGQHGMLPLGWEALRTARPAVELRVHYRMARGSDRAVFPVHEKAFAFVGSYDDYVTFAARLELADLIDSVVVGATPAEALAGRIDADFAGKKHWPDQ